MHSNQKPFFFSLSNGPTLRLFAAAAIASMVSHGLANMNMATINIPDTVLKEFINKSFTDHYGYSPASQDFKTLWGFMVSVPSLVAIFSSQITSILAETFGRKWTVIGAMGAANTLAALISALAKPCNSWELFLIGRVVLGISLGISPAALTLYLTECSPPSQRAMMGSLLSTAACIGTWLVYVLTLPVVLGTAQLWPYAYVIQTALSILFLFLGFTLPESPKYTYLKLGNAAIAEKDVKDLYGPTWEVEKVLKTFAQESEQTKSRKVASYKSLWTERHLRKGMIVGTVAILTRVICGIPLLRFYSARTLRRVLQGNPNANSIAEYVTVAQFFPPILLTLFTAVMLEKLGRRPMILGALSGMTLFNGLFVLFDELNQVYDLPWMTYAAVTSQILSAQIFNLGVTPACFIIISEIMPQAARSKAVSIANGVYYFLFYVYLQIFPLLEGLIKSYTFLVLCVFPAIAALAYLYKELPEPKGKSVDEVVALWMKPDPLPPIEKVDTEMKVPQTDKA